jgi:hypothetical protein
MPIEENQQLKILEKLSNNLHMSQFATSEVNLIIN